MSDRRFLDALVDATLPRIQELITSTFQRATKEVEIIDRISRAVGAEPNDQPLPKLDPRLARSLWGPSLSDVAVSMIWSAADHAVDGHFVCSSQAVTSLMEGIDRLSLARETGIAADDLRFVLREMGDALRGLVEKGPVELMIDQRPLTLRNVR